MSKVTLFDRPLTPEETLVAAYRYLYYVSSLSLIGDYEYDMMEKALPEDSLIRLTVGSDFDGDYPEEAIALARKLLSS